MHNIIHYTHVLCSRVSIKLFITCRAKMSNAFVRIRFINWTFYLICRRKENNFRSHGTLTRYFSEMKNNRNVRNLKNCTTFDPREVEKKKQNKASYHLPLQEVFRFSAKRKIVFLIRPARRREASSAHFGYFFVHDVAASVLP